MSSGSFKSLYSVRSMVRALEQWKEPQTFFLNTFFKETNEHSARHVEINFFDEKRRIAPFVSRRGTGQKVESTAYDKFIWEPPYIKPREDIEPSDLQEALITENPYSTVDPAMRFVEQRNKNLLNLDRIIERREELMAVQAIFDKSIVITDENGSEIQSSIDFTRTAELEFSAGTVWSTAASAKPIKDVRTASRLIFKNSGVAADIAVHGSTAADEFLETSQVQDYLSKNVFAHGTLDMQRQAQDFGVTLMCIIEGIAHYRYDAWYLNPANNTTTAMIPATKVVVGSTKSRNSREYAAIETIATASGMVRARRWPKFYDAENKDPEVYGIQVHSAPLPVMHQPDSFAIITT